MRGRTAVLVLFAALALTAGGCGYVRNGIHNTLEDSLDLVRADVDFGFGTGMGGHVMLTKWVQLKSYSYENVYRFGLGDRIVGLWREDREDWWVGPLHPKEWHATMEPVWASTIGLPPEAIGEKSFPKTAAVESPDEIGVGGYLFLLGFRVGVRPLEIVDLLANFIGMDPSGDSPTWEQRKLWSATKNQPPEPAPGTEAPPKGET